MNQALILTHYYHSGFSAARGRTLLVFDYWRGENGELPEETRVDAAFLRRFLHVYIFISHSHPDHFDRTVYEWRKLVPEMKLHYIISPELPQDVPGERMQPGETRVFSPQLTVKAWESTDLGLAFLAECEGVRIFHAGDLNLWHWREESTVQEIEEAEKDFYAACKPIEAEVRENGPFDIAFFPVDPRQGHLYDAGANYFILSAKPRLFIPMHFWEHTEIAEEFVRRSRTAQTECIAMTRPGETVRIEFDPDGFMTVTLPPPEPPRMPPRPAAEPGEPGIFRETDLPVNLEEGEDTALTNDIS